MGASGTRILLACLLEDLDESSHTNRYLVAFLHYRESLDCVCVFNTGACI